MLTTDCYNTIARDGVAEIKEKSSRFIAYVYGVTDPEQVEPLVAKLRALHHSARHHCYAWRIGADGALSRVNDDGEPSGTAGRPILGQLLSAGVSDVLVVVVRYFGGILLGTSGLIAAYREAAAAVIEEVGVCEKVLYDAIEIEVPYAELDRVMRVVKRRDLRTDPIEYRGANCVVQIEVRCSEKEEVEREVTPASY